MNLFMLIGVAGMVLGIVGLWLNGKFTKDSFVSTRETIVSIICAIILAAGFVQLIAAATEGQQQPEGVAGVVAGVAQNPDGTTTLTVQVGEDRHAEYKIDCLPEQKGCQSARRGDLVQYDRTTHPSGWVAHREIRFITRGANS